MDVPFISFSKKAITLFVSYILGLLPLVGIKTPSGYPRFYKLYISAILIIYYSAVIASFYYFFYQASTEHLPVMAYIGHEMHLILGFIIGTESYLVSFLRSKEYLTFVKYMNQIDGIFMTIRGFGDSIRDAFKYQRNFILIVLIDFVWLIVVDILIFSRIYGNYIYLLGFTYVFSYFAATIVVVQFSTGVYSLYIRFNYINELLRDIAKANVASSETIKAYETINKKRNSISDKSDMFIIPNIHINSAKIEDKVEDKSSEDLKKMHVRLHEIFRIHDSLMDMMEEINKYYAIQVVTFVTASFVLMLFGVFFLTKVVFWIWGHNSNLLFVSATYIFWGVQSGITLYKMLSICAKCRKEANLSAQIIHQMFQNKPAFMINDESFYNKMKSFSLQVLHRKNVTTLTGIGLFTLDYTFIFSVVSAATSYLIVLLQFDLSSDFCRHGGTGCN